MLPHKLLQFSEMLPEKVAAGPAVDRALSSDSRTTEGMRGSPIVAGNGSIEKKNWTAIEETDMIFKQMQASSGVHHE